MTWQDLLKGDNVWQLLIGLFAGGGIGSLISARLAARRSNLDELKDIIEKQREYINRLEGRLDLLSQRVSALECENEILKHRPGVA